ncbi:hypothetical protein M422DRAFT_267640 [Sphaerobolus stellatus SS14]|uniref:Uncharacterized protein n=1 Tax=Sphaerobolus stellatus (strain SS14) TaxID=990650 RepID=A0A0C9U8M6_SPHS4|nr:hypothetical protein M422DRAFT_267640 [Sphaerobolus stellatus SS14]
MGKKPCIMSKSTVDEAGLGHRKPPCTRLYFSLRHFLKHHALQPYQGTSTSTYVPPGPAVSSSSSASTAAQTMPPELEQTLATLISHRFVLEYLVLSRSTEPVSIVRHAGVVFEGEREVGGGESDEKSTPHRPLIINNAPSDSRYVLVVLQNPAMT